MNSWRVVSIGNTLWNSGEMEKNKARTYPKASARTLRVPPIFFSVLETIEEHRCSSHLSRTIFPWHEFSTMARINGRRKRQDSCGDTREKKEAAFVFYQPLIYYPGHVLPLDGSSNIYPCLRLRQRETDKIDGRSVGRFAFRHESAHAIECRRLIPSPENCYEGK